SPPSVRWEYPRSRRPQPVPPVFRWQRSDHSDRLPESGKSSGRKPSHRPRSADPPRRRSPSRPAPQRNLRCWHPARHAGYTGSHRSYMSHRRLRQRFPLWSLLPPLCLPIPPEPVQKPAPVCPWNRIRPAYPLSSPSKEPQPESFSLFCFSSFSSFLIQLFRFVDLKRQSIICELYHMTRKRATISTYFRIFFSSSIKVLTSLNSR